MNYAYNIKVNLKDKLYNFYEWNKEDKIIILKRVNVFVVDDNTYNDILNMSIIVTNEFLKELTDNICIFCNDIDSVCIKFNNKGVISKISKLDLIEENDILEEINYNNKYKLKYTKIDKSNGYSYKTRKEDRIINELNNYIIKNKNDIELINYLYEEWFNNNKCTNKYEKLINAVNGEYSINHDRLYDVVKLINNV